MCIFVLFVLLPGPKGCVGEKGEVGSDGDEGDMGDSGRVSEKGEQGGAGTHYSQGLIDLLVKTGLATPIRMCSTSMKMKAQKIDHVS